MIYTITWKLNFKEKLIYISNNMRNNISWFLKIFEKYYF